MNEFTTNKNKALLWNLMLESNVFDSVPENHFEKVKSMFENEIEEVGKTLKHGSSLTELNKGVLLEMTQKIGSLRTTSSDTVSNVVPITNADIRDQRNKEFTENLSIKQNDFNNMIKLNKPSDIDFTYDKDTPIKDNMDEILENMMKQREKDMNALLSDNNPESASKWINNTSPVLIEDLTDKSKKPNKEVRFLDTEKSSVDLLGFLGKPMQPPLPLLHEMKKMHLECIEKLNICIKQLES